MLVFLDGSLSLWVLLAGIFTDISSLYPSQPMQKCPWSALTKVVLYSEPGKPWAVLMRTSIHFFQPLTRKGKPPRVRDNSVFMITPAGLGCIMCDLTEIV